MQKYSYSNVYKIQLENIREIAKERQLTLKEIAAKIGITETGFLRSIKSNGITLKNAVEVCRVLKVPLDYLVLPLDVAKKIQIDQNNKVEELEKKILELQDIIIMSVKNNLEK